MTSSARRLSLLVAAGALGCGNLAAQAVSAASGAAPTQGKMILDIDYDSRGKVLLCDIVRSNAPFDIEESVIQCVKAQWNDPFFAGTHILVPIIFDGPAAPNPWFAEMATPPNFFPFDGTEHGITLRVEFREDGWVQTCEVVQTGGIDLVDRQIAAWIRVHWHSGEHAGRIVEVPFIFRRETPKPVIADKPKTTRPAAEPAAIPAMRAQ